MDNIIDIKKASLADLDLTRRIAIETYHQTFGDSNSSEDMQLYLSNAFSTEQLTKELANDYSQWFLATWKGETAGYLKLNIKTAQTEMQDKHAMEIQRIYVLQQHKAKGIGKALLKTAFAAAREEGVDFIWLGVWKHNTKAIRFYQQSGFVKIGEHRFLLGNDEQTDWLMKRDIDKVST